MKKSQEEEAVEEGYESSEGGSAVNHISAFLLFYLILFYSRLVLGVPESEGPSSGGC